ncbi:MAG: hypothetical protein JST84_16660 [Acidobacteria bacterium]|nr:hypothetical protein [Acidobacteriota bacterium]
MKNGKGKMGNVVVMHNLRFSGELAAALTTAARKVGMITINDDRSFARHRHR